MLQVVETLSYEKRKTSTRLSHMAADWNSYAVKPVCNDHFYNDIYYLWLIQ